MSRGLGRGTGRGSVCWLGGEGKLDFWDRQGEWVSLKGVACFGKVRIKRVNL